MLALRTHFPSPTRATIPNFDSSATDYSSQCSTGLSPKDYREEPFESIAVWQRPKGPISVNEASEVRSVRRLLAETRMSSEEALDHFVIFFGFT